MWLCSVCCVRRRDLGQQQGHQWCSGNINAFQAFALGSIPGWCMKVTFWFFLSSSHLSFFQFMISSLLSFYIFASFSFYSTFHHFTILSFSFPYPNLELLALLYLTRFLLLFYCLYCFYHSFYIYCVSSSSLVIIHLSHWPFDEKCYNVQYSCHCIICSNSYLLCSEICIHSNI